MLPFPTAEPHSRAPEWYARVRRIARLHRVRCREAWEVMSSAPRPVPLRLVGAAIDSSEWLTVATTFADYDQQTGGNPAYGDIGQWDAVLFKLTGDPVRAQRAADKVLRGFGSNGPGLPEMPTWGRNQTRETAIRLAYFYAALEPALTQPDRELWRQRMESWVDFMFPPEGSAWSGQGTRIGDSDEVTGHYFGVRAIDQASGTVYLNRTEMANFGQPGIYPASPADARTELLRYLNLARGGEWLESAEYNRGTLKILISGHLLQAFPEVAAILPAVAEQTRRNLMVGLTDYVPWGDIEGGGRWLPLDHLVPLLCMLATATGDPDGKLREMIAWFDRDGPQSWWFGLWEALWWFDPATLPTPPTEPPRPPDGLGNALDVGIVTYQQPGSDEKAWVHTPGKLLVDHQVQAPTFGVHRGGVAIIDGQRGYGTDVFGLNAPVLSGLHYFQAMLEDYGQTSILDLDGDGFIVEWRQTGQYPFFRGDTLPHEQFCDEHMRRIEYMPDSLPGSILIRDTFRGRQIPDPERYPNDVQAQIAARRALWDVIQQATSEPVQIDETRWQWTAPTGDTVTMTATGQQSVVIVTPGPIAGVAESEWSRFWQIHLLSDEGEAVIEYTLAWGSTPPVPPPEPIPPEPIPPDPVEVWELVGEAVTNSGTIPISFGPDYRVIRDWTETTWLERRKL